MKLNTFEKVMGVIISGLLVLTLFFAVLRNTTVPDAFDMDLYHVFNVAKYALIEKPYKALVGWAQDISRMLYLREENDRLRREIDSVNSYKSELMEARRQLDYLQELLDLQTVLNRYDLINATVIGRDLSTWSNSIQINVGSADGIDRNYAVVTPSGLIGRIHQTYEHTSIVKLLTAEDGLNKVSVQIQISAKKVANAYLETYDAEKGTFVVKLLSTGDTINPGMAVSTSGMGGIFPSGLFVGTVVEVAELENAIGMNVYVRPAADFLHLNYVSIVIMKEGTD